MTNEDRQRTMEFILEQQAQMVAHIQQLEEERIRDRPRLARLEQSFKTLVDLAKVTDARLDTLELRSSSIEERTSGVEKHTNTLEKTTNILAEVLQRLTRLVEVSEARLNRLESRS